jgi:hypothetical protein
MNKKDYAKLEAEIKVTRKTGREDEAEGAKK